MNEFELRAKALELALAHKFIADRSSKDVVDAAEKFLVFLRGGQEAVTPSVPQPKADVEQASG